MVLAPVAVLPLVLAAAAVVWLGDRLGLPPLAVGLLVVGALALGTRAFHLDGLADTADGLTASYDRDRTLAVMRSGDVGPAGVVALLLVLGLQAAAVSALVGHDAGPWLVAGAVVLSRATVALQCARPVPAADASGLGAMVAGTVPVAVATATCVAASALVVALGLAAGQPWWQPVLAVVLALLVVAALLRRAVLRIGGTSGDVLGAGIELSLATALLVLA